MEILNNLSRLVDLEQLMELVEKSFSYIFQKYVEQVLSLPVCIISHSFTIPMSFLFILYNFLQVILFYFYFFIISSVSEFYTGLSVDNSKSAFSSKNVILLCF